MIIHSHPGAERFRPDESEVIHAEREEAKSLRDAEDFGGTKRVCGTRYLTEDLPSFDEIDL